MSWRSAPTTPSLVGSMQITLGYYLPTYEAAKLKRVINNDIWGIDEETMARIDAEIEDGLKEGKV